ncbi:uncharacterized protein BJ171DRAFT_122571 [Polychytrium aggregatum]|uniref:uncharacterized protein n=1 Tax=Polychytrium aggregatum TaxID=110093 RepID=UPI0022FE4513|nr:uncharacterized protein BJ171DRAFT_122571 [Polychytrium aggregatum]KAI9204299.1 hypothetical protein BJ171DRAFT_122571 [Polychytrium aggregatum]
MKKLAGKTGLGAGPALPPRILDSSSAFSWVGNDRALGSSPLAIELVRPDTALVMWECALLLAFPCISGHSNVGSRRPSIPERHAPYRLCRLLGRSLNIPLLSPSAGPWLHQYQQQQQQDVRNLRSHLQSVESNLADLDQAIDGETRHLQKLQKFSFTKFKTKISGTNAEQIEEAQKTLFRLEQQRNQCLEGLAGFGQQLGVAEALAAELGAKCNRFGSLCSQLHSLLDQYYAPPTPSHPDNEAILSELNQTQVYLLEQQDRLERFRRALQMASEAVRYYRLALDCVQTALQSGTTDIFFRNGFSEINEYDNSQQAKAAADKANALLRTAIHAVPPESGVNASQFKFFDIGSLSVFGTLVFDNYFTQSANLDQLQQQQSALIPVINDAAHFEGYLRSSIEQMQSSLLQLVAQQSEIKARLLNYRLSNLAYEYESVFGKALVLEIPLNPE